MARARYDDEERDPREYLRRITQEERDSRTVPPPPPPPAFTNKLPPAPAEAPPPPPAFHYTPPVYRGPSSPAIPNLPVFNPPDFEAPDYAALQNDPSYQFRLREGERALQGSAAARGVLRTGGTLRDIINYGQAAASQESQAAYDRAVQSYGLRYNRARDIFAPRLLDYSTRAGANTEAYRQLWDRYRVGLDDEFRREALVSGMQPPSY